MKITQMIAKPSIFIAVVGIFAMTFQSCQREGCPGQITKVDEITVEQTC